MASPTNLDGTHRCAAFSGPMVISSPSGRYYICTMRRAASLIPWMLSARYAVPVAVITSATLGRRRSSRPVGYAVGDVGFLFAFGKVGRDALRISPTCILDRLWGGESRGQAENEASNRHRCVPQFHGTPHRGACCPGVLSHTSRLASNDTPRLSDRRAWL